ncbi:MAG: YceI family protein [Gaiellaceae bacterium]
MTTLTAASALETGAWQLDPVHSRVGFAVDYLAGTFHGSFAPFEATLIVDERGTATLSGSAKVESIQVQDENLGAHLASPEFFDAEQAPEIAFESDRFEPDGAFVAVPGKLTIKGATRPVQLTGTINGPLVDPYGRKRFNVRLQTTVDRSAFGLDWNVSLPSGEPALAQDVTLDAELGFIKG